MTFSLLHPQGIGDHRKEMEGAHQGLLLSAASQCRPHACLPHCPVLRPCLVSLPQIYRLSRQHVCKDFKEHC